VTVDATSVGRGAERFAMEVSQPGAHNRLNATAAWAAAVAVGAFAAALLWKRREALRASGN